MKQRKTKEQMSKIRFRGDNPEDIRQAIRFCLGKALSDFLFDRICQAHRGLHVRLKETT